MIVEFIVISCLLLLLVAGLVLGKKNQQEAQGFTDFFIGRQNFSTLIILSTIFAGVMKGSSITAITAIYFSRGYFYLLLGSISICIAHLWTGFWVAKKMGPYLDSLSPGDILEKMYGREAKIIMGVTGLLESIAIISIQLIAFSFICHYFFSISHAFSAFGALLFTLAYSLRGGIKTVIMSNILQFILFLIILPIICCLILARLGSFDSLLVAFATNSPEGSQAFDLNKDMAAFIYNALPALFPLALQRMVMAKDVHQLKKAFIANSLINFVFLACILIIGLYTYMMVPHAEAKTALFSVIGMLSPISKGLIIFGLLTLLMSTINAFLNVAAVAITQDLFLPFYKKELSEATKLKIAKFFLVGVGTFAAIVAMLGNKIFFTAYFIIFLNASVMLTLYMLGFLNFKPSKRGFLSSVALGILFLCIACFIFDMYTYYAALITIGITSVGVIASHYLNTTPSSKMYQIPLPNNKKKFRWFDVSVKNLNYCNVFASIVLINSFYPYFLMFPPFNLVEMPFFFMYPLISSISFLILSKEIWPSNWLKYFPWVWHGLITLSLPTLAFLMYFQSNFSSLWLIDIFVVTALVSIITKPNMALVTSVSGALIAIIITMLIGVNFSEYVVNIGLICLFGHMVSLIICLFFFKEQEKELYRSVSSKITHEAARSLSGIGLSAFLLEKKMEQLIYGYKLALAYDLIPQEIITHEELQELKELPFNLNGMGKRTSQTLHCLLHKMDKEIESQKKLETLDIISLVKQAILDPSFSVEQRKKMVLNTYHNFFLTVASSEIIHVIINLIENALGAIQNKSDGRIEIWANDASLFIKDNGSGIDRQILHQIFDEGFSTKGTSGQGLAFCKKIMEEHAGRILCASKKDIYTQFELRFSDNK